MRQNGGSTHRSWLSPYMLRLGTTYVMVTPTYVKFESHLFQGGDKHNYQGFP